MNTGIECRHTSIFMHARILIHIHTHRHTHTHMVTIKHTQWSVQYSSFRVLKDECANESMNTNADPFT